jgi:hypothetical protein
MLGSMITMLECEVDWARKKNRRKDDCGCGHGLRGRRNWLASVSIFSLLEGHW